ncbi:hypothetical protein [Aeromonas caviae]|uniref:Uncharacterized protein n=1 Tax=Aeromonas caviae TaxID=648 RepID=A0AAJ5ZCC5_AERCA|nr:hypothetical protein [Aeromonas caviae]WFF99914.1 hypothetical protein P5S46_10225 [Aeromonas caviae]
MADTKRGGARAGAGRPKGEETTMVRVPQGCLEAVRALISEYRIHGYLPSVQPVAVQSDDRSTQVDSLPASQVNAESVPVLQSVERRSNPASDAWAVYESSIADCLGFIELKERFFRVAEEGELNGYHFTYLFFLQLLERLCSMTAEEGYIPAEWGNIRCLRVFVMDFYKANPQWH